MVNMENDLWIFSTFLNVDGFSVENKAFVQSFWRLDGACIVLFIACHLGPEVQWCNFRGFVFSCTGSVLCKGVCWA